jgi:hypothetical protein
MNGQTMSQRKKGQKQEENDTQTLELQRKKNENFS